MASSDNSWVFDSLICFLNGPMWNVPIQSFIEEKCLVFEPNDVDDDEFRKIHQEFKNLVDLLLGSYMEDICISTEQFEVACNQLVQEKFSSLFEQNIFEQIWAANDFDLFIQMMTEKNTELQLQALELHKKKVKKVSIVEPARSVENSPHKVAVSHVPQSEKEIMVEVIRNYEPIEVPVEMEDIIEEEDSSSQDENKEPEQEQEEKLDDTTDSRQDSKFEAPKKINEEDIKKRQEYLKMQRDKLIALKKQVRTKHLQEEIQNTDIIKSRPKSAKTAEAALSGTVQVGPEVLRIRKVLAEKLRSEVVANKNN